MSYPLRGLINRLFQLFARILPGAESVRVILHRARGVKIGKNVWISQDVVLVKLRCRGDASAPRG
jgi:acetyltransferase-like isoleucine patch superfamily enzyme